MPAIDEWEENGIINTPEAKFLHGMVKEFNLFTQELNIEVSRGRFPIRVREEYRHWFRVETDDDGTLLPQATVRKDDDKRLYVFRFWLKYDLKYEITFELMDARLKGLAVCLDTLVKDGKPLLLFI